jgi:hypothetical protein
LWKNIYPMTCSTNTAFLNGHGVFMLRICSQFYSEVSERKLRQSLTASGNGVTFADEVTLETIRSCTITMLVALIFVFQTSLGR